MEGFYAFDTIGAGRTRRLVGITLSAVAFESLELILASTNWQATPRIRFTKATEILDWRQARVGQQQLEQGLAPQG